MQTVPSLLVAVVALLACVIMCLVLRHIWNEHYACVGPWPSGRAAVPGKIFAWAGTLLALLAVAALITAISVQQMHWDQSCHRLGGVIGGGSSECLKPNSTINVP